MASYTSPWGLLPYQADGAEKLLLTQHLLCTWETGLGKGHLCMATAAALVDSGHVSRVLVVCESNKLDEWRRDFETFTDLRVKIYAGTVAQRTKLRGTLPEVIIGTYETFRNDLVGVTKVKRRKTYSDGPLLEVLAHETGLAVYFDESGAKLGNRLSTTYKAQERTLRTLRKRKAHIWATELTATPVESSPENAFNQWRLIDPVGAPTVAEFEEAYVKWRDPNRRTLATYKNISLLDLVDPGVVPFATRIQAICHHKSKTDPDVADKFPDVTVQPPIYVPLDPAHQTFYNAVSELHDDPTLFPPQLAPDAAGDLLLGLLRQIASHPAALLASEGRAAQAIVDQVGAEYLRSLKVAKLDRLVSRLDTIVRQQGAQALVFSFFGQSVIPLLAERLRAEGYLVVTHTGADNQARKAEAQEAFRSGKAQIFLSSDAGSRGINLPEASYVIHYEVPSKFSTLTQRTNRAVRLGAGGGFVTVDCLVAADTVEEGLVGLNFKREDWHGAIVDGADQLGKLPSAARKALFRQAKDLATAS